jgi:hypothetical protein
MIRKTFIFTVMIIFSLSISFNLLSGQTKPFFGLGGGISKALGDGSEYWNLGFVVFGDVFVAASENMLIGGHVAYNRWSPNEDELLGSYASIPGLTTDISGSASIIEIVPSIRLTTSGEGQSVKFFGQGGAGIYILKMEADASASYMGQTFSMSIDHSESKFGINVGAGLIINEIIEVYPMYNNVFTEGESTTYFSVNVGVLFGGK